jgi:hypothetical protein
MMETLNCIFNNTDMWDYTIFRKYCKNPYDDNLCRAVDNNYTSGVYGSYDGCAAQEQSSWILNQIFISKGRDPASCTSAGGTIQTPTGPQSLESDCQSFLQQAGPDGIGKVTATPSPLSLKRPENDSHLNSGAKIGLGVGLSILALICIAVAFGLYRRRRKIPSAPETASRDESDFREDFVLPKVELEDSPVTPKKSEPGGELDSSQKHELEADMPHELPAPIKHELESVVPHELESPMPHEIDGQEIAELPGDDPVHEMKHETVEKLVHRGFRPSEE